MRINPKENIYGQYKVSPDISITHRAIILGALAKGKTYIINPCLNDDTYTSIACIKKLGAKAKVKNGVIEIKPPKAINGDIRVDCGRSETLMRFLCGVAAGSGIGVELTGDKWLCQRPMRNVKEPLEAMGATVALKNYSVPPILVEGATVRPIDYFLPIGSSQVKTSILLCALTGGVKATIKEGLRSRNHMENLLKEMGADITVDEKENSVTLNKSEIKGSKIFVCGDFTEAMFFLAQGLLSGRAECKNVCVNPTRTRVFQILKRMGAKIQIVNRRMLCGEPIADIIAEKSELKAVLVTDEEAFSVADELPALAVLMGMAGGESVVAEHPAMKERDKNLYDEISAMLNSAGGKCRRFSGESANGIAISGVLKYRGGNVRGLTSARVAMAAAIALEVSEEGGELDEESLVSAEYPGFFGSLKGNSFAHLVRFSDKIGISAINAFILRDMKLENFSCSVKSARNSTLKKTLSEFKELDGFSVCSQYISDAAKKALKYRGLTKITKLPDAVRGIEGLATDGYAVVLALKSEGEEIENKRVLIAGCGSVGKNIAVALKDKKADVCVYDTNPKAVADIKKRLKEEIETLQELPEDREFDIIVNATPLGLGEKEGLSPLAIDFMSSAHIVIDCVPSLEKTKILMLADEANVKTVSGAKLAFFKAYAADCLFAGVDMNDEQALRLFGEYTETEATV